MNRKKIAESEKQQQAPEAKRQNFFGIWQHTSGLYYEESKVTPVILLVLGSTARVYCLALVFLGQ